jgi:hypothetical protein
MNFSSFADPFSSEVAAKPWKRTVSHNALSRALPLH